MRMISLMVAKLLQESSARAALIEFELALSEKAQSLNVVFTNDDDLFAYYDSISDSLDVEPVTRNWVYDSSRAWLVNFDAPEYIPMEAQEVTQLVQKFDELEKAVDAEDAARSKSSFQSRYQSSLNLDGIEGDFDKHIFTSKYEPQTPEPTLEEKKQHTVYTSGEYFFIKLPADPDFIQWEGKNMQHCLQVAHHDYVARMKKGEIELYSLVKPDGKPAVDIEVAISHSSYGGPVKEPAVYQVRGPRNQCPPDDAFIPALMDFFTNYGKNWNLTGHGLGNFDSKRDGKLVADRFQQLQAEK